MNKVVTLEKNKNFNDFYGYAYYNTACISVLMIDDVCATSSSGKEKYTLTKR
jgi:hypothetical protein